MKRQTTYHIIGGGVSGLACALVIKQKDKKSKVIVYEANSHLGGRAYSYDDKELNNRFDNATHIIDANDRFLSTFVKKNEWVSSRNFYDMNTQKISISLHKNKNKILKIRCNTASDEIAKSIKHKMFYRFLPFAHNNNKIWFSKQDLSQRIINLLSVHADEIKLNHRLVKISSQFGMASVLDFGNTQVEISAKDKVIIALDNNSCSKILNVPLLKHNQIINIIYQTSQTVFLPKGASVVAIKNGICDFITSHDNLITAVIKDYKGQEKDLSSLALKVWKEIDKIRGVNSGFMPAYRAACYPMATISHDRKTNKLRPNSAISEYPNVFIAGDWTMKNYNCSMETSIRSALRAVKTAIKKK